MDESMPESFRLRERIKELQCLIDIIHLIHDPRTATGDLTDAVAAKLPDGFQFPDRLAARIVVGDRTAASEGFVDSTWRLETGFRLEAGDEGTIAVAYATNPATGDGPPFLPEEKTLLEAVADALRLGLDHRRSVEALARDKEKFRAMFHDQLAVKFILDAHTGDILEANQAAADFYGWPVETLVGMNIGQINTLPSDRLKKAIRDIREGGRFHRDFRHRKADGGIADVEVYATEVRIDGRDCLHSIIFDVSEKKRLFDRLRLLEASLEHLSSSVVITDRDGRIEYANPFFTELTGYTREELVGANPRILQGGPYPPGFFEDLWETILSGRDWRGTFRNRKKDGTLYWEEAVISPVPDENGTITHFVGVKQDITATRQLLEDLRTAKERAEESDHLKTAFLANISHEIRTPMNAIQGFVQLLKDPRLGKEDREDFLNEIQVAGDRMLATINDIVALSRIEAHLIGIEVEPADIGEAVADVVESLRPSSDKKGLRLVYEKERSPRDRVFLTDPEKLGAVLTVLLKNAVKFTPVGEVRVAWEEVDDELLFSVADTGIGIRETVKDRIFDDFEQGDGGSSRPYEGAGIGLSIAKAYVEALGGRIRFESTEGTGTAFRFALPAKRPAAGREDSVGEDAAAADTGPSGGIPVLIAEDDDTNFKFLSLVFAPPRFAPVRARNGTEAVALHESRPDLRLILMDLKMPEMDGFEAVRRIRERDSEIPIIAQTAYAFDDDRHRVMTAGFDDYLTKPTRKHELLRKVEKHLHRAGG
ncbi:MAG: PAS domain S-box protein [Puniceicoccaceae bacterium]